MHLRLVADDLTGALDSAACFAARAGQVAVFWAPPAGALPASAALDIATREQDKKATAATAAAFAAALAPTPDTVAFWKLDSLLRGHGATGLAAGLQKLRPAHCLIAPAFPFQGRITRAGQQYARDGAGWRPVGEPLHDTLARHGIVVTLVRPGDTVPPGVSLWDAETEDDLHQIATAGRALSGPVLWSGSGGLAALLAGAPADLDGPFPAPLLGLFGSDHPVTAAQLREARAHHLPLAGGDAASAAGLAARLTATGTALASFDLPAGTDRVAAAAWIDRELSALLPRLAPPRTLVVAGGETLRAICTALGATHLEVRGQLQPGVPCSIMRGGAWDGVVVVSKSGAFGAPDLLRRIADNIEQNSKEPGA
ncbi:putative D-threonate kinase [Rhodovastum atsumiense]|uniref:Four-carbon acid sugar kinase family protein n=1 Tax=Rhodovastum atsumiense TaxID=504468 RepID=A0A5M6IYR9_9PROT|nr:four-carbon acid sugar kinase family protein [Rhodovastum atsumiense]KAA5613431.1 hypothetical protein F1189_05070 [Rhodovastum atsumiense]CAH2603161.1 putative D-threonate kinase [Rhodovastum atsumiense]